MRIADARPITGRPPKPGSALDFHRACRYEATIEAFEAAVRLHPSGGDRLRELGLDWPDGGALRDHDLADLLRGLRARVVRQHLVGDQHIHVR